MIKLTPKFPPGWGKIAIILSFAGFAVILRAAIPIPPATTFLELGLHWPVAGVPSYTGPGVTNAVTTITDSHGTLLGVSTNNPFPHINLPVALDVYTIHVTAAATNANPALDWTFTLPMATNVPGFTAITSYVATVAFDPTGNHGKVKAQVSAEF
jgi:hypothetical protein